MENKFYWEIDPQQIVKHNKKLLSKLFHNSDYKQVYYQINLLIEIYNKESLFIKGSIKSINSSNFFITIKKIFEKEALLSEIYFYLANYEWDYDKKHFDQNIIKTIQTDYLSDYYWKLGNIEENKCPKLLLGVLTEQDK